MVLVTLWEKKSTDCMTDKFFFVSIFDFLTGCRFSISTLDSSKISKGTFLKKGNCVFLLTPSLLHVAGVSPNKWKVFFAFEEFCAIVKVEESIRMEFIEASRSNYNNWLANIRDNMYFSDWQKNFDCKFWLTDWPNFFFSIFDFRLSIFDFIFSIFDFDLPEGFFMSNIFRKISFLP